MSLYALADHMASKGRNGDTMLVHMTPGEVAGLQALARAHGGSLTINPDTGLPEAFSLKKALKKLAAPALGFALNAFVPGLGTAIGGALGTSSAVGTALAVGGASALATGSLSRGLTAGLGAYGGAAIGGGITGAGVGAAQQAAISALGPGASQEAMNLAAAEATKNYLGSAPGMWTASAPIGIGERLMQSASAAFANPSLVVQNMGGLNKVLQAGYAAATPTMMASAEEQRNEMPKALGSPTYYRPYEYDPETKGLRSLGTVDAAKANATPIAPAPKPVNVQTTTPMPGMASGGIARLASGGTATGSVLDASRPDNRLRVNNEVLDPRLEPYLHKTPDGRVSMYMGDGWYSGFASGQELENLKAKQQENFARLGLGPAQPQITSTEATRPTTEITPSSYSVSGERIAPPTSTTPLEIASTEAVRPTTSITPSSYTVSGESIAAPTSTAPPQITSTEAVRPTTRITPSFLTTQAAAPVPLTSTAPPTITASAAPIMPSIPVGGGGDAGVAAVRPFDWQSAQIEELPEVQQKRAEDAMTGQSLDAYRRLMGLGAAQMTGGQPLTGTLRGAPQTVTPYAYVSNPLGQQIDASQYKTVSTASGGDYPSISAGVDPVTGEPYQWAWDGSKGQFYTAKSVSRAAGGTVRGYALGGLSSLGGFSDGGQLLKGPGDGVSDSIPATIGGTRPARLADGEFVVPARVVSELGNGSTEAGARKLYAMMDRVQNARGKTIGKGRVAVDAHADKYLPA